MKSRLQVMLAFFEAVPFMKTGGLGDVGGSLPGALREAGVVARLVIPKFSGIPEEYRAR
ncbi:MAG: glycogen/starch synthase, partial [Mogibacterium sp.]|nr:glycogen/starch synthase [Mogibacterium sp.]